VFLLPLAIIAAVALTLWFIFTSDASVVLKAVVVLLLAGSWLLRYTRFALVGFFLQIALAIFILLYEKANSRG
jgi:hypothetical protein